MNLSKYKRIVSGIQPTGNLHIGNYLGSLKTWQTLEENKTKNHLENQKLIFSIVDLHSITNKYSNESQQNQTNIGNESLELLACILGSGLDPKKCNIFLQSRVPEICELQWILGCVGPMSWLNFMTQFKSKKQKGSSLGLFSYPTLMAADILAFQADAVPVGEDQVQHLELTKDYANKFNNMFGQVLTVPKLIPSQVPRVMSLRDGTVKMSKSDRSQISRINIRDSPEEIFAKVMKAKTDNIQTILYDKVARPEISNLIKIYQGFSGLQIEEIQNHYRNKSTQQFKEDLAELITKEIYPIHLKANDYLEDRQYLVDFLKVSSEEARDIAVTNITEIKKVMGFIV